MKLLFDFLPIFLFFIAYKAFGIYTATAVAMLASLIQVGFSWLKYRKIESLPLITLVMVLVLGGATLVLHNAIFIKWKPTAIYWVFALMFLFTQLFTKKTLLQTLMDKKITLPLVIWQRLNLSWGIFFAIMGFLNLYIVYHFSTNVWVNFKLFGALGLMIVFLIGQAVYMTRYIEPQDKSKV